MIQWFPGHMHAARKAVALRLMETDVVIEVLDARLPGSSANPMLAALASGKPSLKVLTKCDLADPVQTDAWCAHYDAVSATQAMQLSAEERGAGAVIRRIRSACVALAPGRGSMAKPLRVLIAGVPNAGKSTLVNALVGRRASKTGDIAGVTQRLDRITLEDGFYLWDSPGMLWPKIEAPESGINLAASGAVGRNAYEDVLVALPLLGYLKTHYAAELAARYGLVFAKIQADAAATPQALASLSDDALLEAIAKKRVALRARGLADVHKAAELLIADLRSGALGRITLETPAEFATWQQQAQLAAQQAASRASEKAAAKKASRTSKTPQQI
jgi:ribosome biogenesis GTPase A